MPLVLAGRAELLVYLYELIDPPAQASRLATESRPRAP
jgi:hypothetical protein